MPADMNQAEYYKQMAAWATENGYAAIVEHSNGNCGIAHNGGLEASQLEAVYFGILANAGMLTEESKFLIPAGEVMIDKVVVAELRKPSIEVTPKPEPAAASTPAPKGPQIRRPGVPLQPSSAPNGGTPGVRPAGPRRLITGVVPQSTQGGGSARG